MRNAASLYKKEKKSRDTLKRRQEDFSLSSDATTKKRLKLINEVEADTSVEKRKEIIEKAYKPSKAATATYIETAAVTSGKPKAAKSTKTSASASTMTTAATSKKTTTSTSGKISTFKSTKTTAAESTKTTAAASGDATKARSVTVTSTSTKTAAKSTKTTAALSGDITKARSVSGTNTSSKTTAASAKTKTFSRTAKNNHFWLSTYVNEIIRFYLFFFCLFILKKKTSDLILLIW